MGYEGLAKTLVQHRQEIAYDTAQSIFDQQLWPYTEKGLEPLVNSCTEAIEAFARHVRAGNTQEYRRYVVEVATQLRQRGYSAAATQKANLIMLEKMKEVVEREFGGPIHEKTRQTYLTRLEVLFSLDSATAVNTLMKEE